MNTLARMTRRRRTLTVGVAAFAMAASGALVASQALTPPPAHLNGTAGLQEVGPIDEANGYPMWYKDTNGVKLQLCLDPSDGNCIIGAVPDPTKPVSFPDNFPDEAFYSSADASIDYGSGTAQLVTAVEAAFASADGLAAKGQQITFGRIRLRASGLKDGAEYKVTHPFGVDTVTSEPGAFKGVNTTEDVGSLTPDGVFDQTLGSRPGPFLKWDPAVAPAAPAGYLGNATVAHPVVGSAFKTNFFRVEGPAGSFTGSTDLCSDPTLGDSPTALDDCIQTNDFLVHGKLATRMGVQATQAYYTNSGTGHLMDLFAKSEPGQNIVVKGTGIAQTKMREDAAIPGRYYARVFADGAPPADLSVTNTTDAPDSVDHIELAMFGDKVHILSSVYSNDNRTLTVSAQSGDDTAALKLDKFPTITPSVANGVTTWTVPALDVPPAEVMVTSNKGGVDTDDVVITGTQDQAVGVVALITGDLNTVQVGQTVTLDGLSSTGTVTGYDWSVSPAGASITPVATDGSSVTFKASAAGTYTVELTVTGKNNTSTADYTIDVLSGGASPVANAGPDQVSAVPTSTVTLDGTGSKFASTFNWAQDPTDAVKIALKSPTTANPAFVVPPSSKPLTFNFTLTIKDVNGTAATDSVAITTDPGAVTVDSAFYKRGDLQWRVRGTVKYCSANNSISVYWNKPVSGGGTTPVLVGSTSPSLALGVCSYEFRQKNVASAVRPTAAGTITVRSAYGGEALNEPFDFI